MTEVLAQPPPTLYRGITLAPSEVNEDIFGTADLIPGSGPLLNETGQVVVEDGNEYGVYMSDNPQMAATAAAPRHGAILPGSPTFNWRGDTQSQLEVPRVGVLYEIEATGLQVRRPHITPVLQGHYNNNFTGDEWIIDKVPAGHYHLATVTLGKDLLHPAVEFDAGMEPAELVDAIKTEVANRTDELNSLARRIQDLPESKRRAEYTIGRVVTAFQAERSGPQQRVK